MKDHHPRCKVWAYGSCSCRFKGGKPKHKLELVEKGSGMTTKELRELDAWIAEYVMGWKWFVYKPEKDHAYSGRRTLMDKPHRFLKSSKGNEPWAEDAFYNVLEYTTDPAAAMQVLEKCARRTKTAVFLTSSRGWQIEGSNGMILDDIETLPLAICKFAKELFAKKD